ncbi:unnamed protein product [Penicillium salamii]|uniref:Uncharacterized protein n=1 Tax=Penicillium salamii TaxID=1612424 RepID=A0A9W4IN69_9EURO|nr:unnamed protein product [Penicillium salamii]CAG8198454.1 unnamed protein product [Penicillium salamii]CAG8282217.1 unnamed protein product [Penicillium salamii]CAG8328869.1 unnamed protein product [Penicillium salamii]CAG8340222.1 unnamed protein product [Penicillium salamii]
MDQMYNRITVDSQIHTYWNAGLVALRLVNRNEDETEMKFALHWFHDRQELNDIFRPNQTFGNNLYIHTSHEDGSMFMVTSGGFFALKTTDKEKYPLPLFELLESRWHLSRISVMQGSDEDED